MRKHWVLMLLLLLAGCGNSKLQQARRDLDQSYRTFLTVAGSYRHQFMAVQSAWLTSVHTICSDGASAKHGSSCLAAEFTARAELYRVFTDAQRSGIKNLSPDVEDSQLLTFLATDAFNLIPFAPEVVLPIFRTINDNVNAKMDPLFAHAPLWGEILLLRYEMPPSSESLERMVALFPNLEDKSSWSCTQYDEPGCGSSPSYSKVGWLINGLTNNGSNLALPCRLVALHPELMDAIRNSVRFVVGASCDTNDFPWPDSINAFDSAIAPYGGDLVNGCGGTAVRDIAARTASDMIEAQVLPRRLLPASANSDGQNGPQIILGQAGDVHVTGTASPIASFQPPRSSFAETGTEHPLEAWSYQSVANRHSYLRIDRLFRQAVAALAKAYTRRFKLTNADAQAAAEAAIARVSAWTFTGPPSPLAVAIMRADAKPDLNTLLAAKATIAGTDEPLLSLASDRPAAIGPLLRANASPNATNSFGKTPLMTAAQVNNAESVTLLLKAGADINTQSLSPDVIPGNAPPGSQCGGFTITHGRRTALMYAAANAGLPLIRQLLAAGANAALRDSTGLTARDYLQGAGPVPRNPLLSAPEYATASRLLNPKPR